MQQRDLRAEHRERRLLRRAGARRDRAGPGRARPGPDGVIRCQVDPDRPVQKRGELIQAQRRAAPRALAADRGEMPPADKAGARVGEGAALAAAAAPAGLDRADPLPAVPQAPLVPDVPAGRGDLEEQRRAVVGRAAERHGVCQGMQAVEPAPAPPAGRLMPRVPHADRVGGHVVDPPGAERQPREPGPRAVRGHDRVRQLVAGERPVRALVALGPRGTRDPEHGVPWLSPR